MKTRIVTVLSILLSSSLAAQAASPDPTEDSFDRLFRAGLERDPRAAAIDRSFSAAKASAAETAARRLLDLSAAGSYAYALPDSGAKDATGDLSPKLSASTIGPLGSTIKADLGYLHRRGDADYLDSMSAGASISLPILVNGGLVDPRLSPAAKRLAVDSAVEAAIEARTSERCSFVLSLLSQILEYSAARTKAGLAERAAAISAQDLEIARVKYANGILSFKELREAESEAGADRLEAISSRTAFKNSAGKLASRTGIPASEIEGLPIACPAAPPGFASGSAAAAEGCPAVRSAERELKDAEASRIVAGAKSAPALSLSGDYDWELRDTFLGEPKRGPLTLSASVALDLGFAAAAREREAAAAKAAAAALRLEAAKAQAAADSGDAAAKADAARAQAEYLAAAVESARARLSELRVSATSGTVLPVDVDRAGLALDQARADLEGKRSELLLALAEVYLQKGLDASVLLSDLRAFGAR